MPELTLEWLLDPSLEVTVSQYGREDKEYAEATTLTAGGVCVGTDNESGELTLGVESNLISMNTRGHNDADEKIEKFREGSDVTKSAAHTEVGSDKLVSVAHGNYDATESSPSEDEEADRGNIEDSSSLVTTLEGEFQKNEDQLRNKDTVEATTTQIDKLNLLEISVAKLPSHLSTYPCWCTNIFDQASSGCSFYSVTRTPDELSVIIDSKILSENLDFRDGPINIEPDWVAFKVVGQLDFALIGIITKISSLLSENEISLFVSSTFLTDYILVKKDKALNAQRVLTESGLYRFTNSLKLT